MDTYRDGWIYIDNETEGARPATEDEIAVHQYNSNMFDGMVKKSH
ncbi:hypothetical protein [Pectobacterium brasiliense]